jgi:hypothetical protein
MRIMQQVGAAGNGSDVASATERLKEPRQRLAYELFWYWPETERPLPADDDAAGWGQAAKRWTDGATGSPEDPTAMHNHALYSLDRLLDATEGDLPRRAGEALRAMTAALGRSAPYIRDRVAALEDPRLTRVDADDLLVAARTLVPLLALRLAVAAHIARVPKAVAQVVRESCDAATWATVVRQAAGPPVMRVGTLADAAEREARADVKSGAGIARRLLDTTKRDRRLVTTLLTEGDPIRDGMYDDLVQRIIACVIPFYNQTEDDVATLSVLAATERLSAGPAARAQVRKNIDIIEGNAEIKRQDGVRQAALLAAQRVGTLGAAAESDGVRLAALLPAQRVAALGAALAASLGAAAAAESDGVRQAALLVAQRPGVTQAERSNPILARQAALLVAQRVAALGAAAAAESNADVMTGAIVAQRLLDATLLDRGKVAVLLNHPQGDPIVDGMYDYLVQAVLACVIPYYNATEDVGGTLSVLEAAMVLAWLGGAAVRAQVIEAIATLDRNPAGAAAARARVREGLTATQIATCWFCTSTPAAAAAAYVVDIHEKIGHTPPHVTWKQAQIGVPRCSSCSTKQTRMERRGCLQTTISMVVFGAIGFALTGSPLWCVAGVVLGFLLITWAPGGAAAQGGRALEYPPLQEKLATGWHLGKRPAGTS